MDVVDARRGVLLRQIKGGFKGFTGNNDTSGPDGVLTANKSTEIWVGDSPSRPTLMNRKLEPQIRASRTS